MSVSFVYDKNWSKLIDDLEAFVGNLDDVFLATLNDLGNFLITKIQERAPTSTGNYGASWFIKEVDSEHLIVDTPHGDLAVFLEFGTQPHVILPKDKKVLSWIGPDGVRRFATIVFHPGTPPMPHVRPAIELAIEEIQTIFLNNLRGITGIGLE